MQKEMSTDFSGHVPAAGIAPEFFVNLVEFLFRLNSNCCGLEVCSVAPVAML
jgi:hypothetical protein